MGLSVHYLVVRWGNSPTEADRGRYGGRPPVLRGTLTASAWAAVKSRGRRLTLPQFAASDAPEYVSLKYAQRAHARVSDYQPLDRQSRQRDLRLCRLQPGSRVHGRWQERFHPGLQPTGVSRRPGALQPRGTPGRGAFHLPYVVGTAPLRRRRNRGDGVRGRSVGRNGGAL